MGAKHGCAQRQEHRLRVSENMVLRIFRPKRRGNRGAEKTI